MSDAIETGSRRKTRRISRPRTQSVEKPKKIDRTKDELEFGNIVGETRTEQALKKPKEREQTDLGEVVGPKRPKVDPSIAKKKKKQADIELQIAAPRDTEDDATPSRPRARRRSQKKATPKDGWGNLAGLVGLALSSLIVLMTAVTFFLLPRYEIVGDPLIEDPIFATGLDGWTQSGLIVPYADEPGRIVLESFDPDERTHLIRDIDLPPGDVLLELSASVQGEDVVPGAEVWDRARIYLAQLSPDGQPVWKENHLLFDLDGTTDVRNYRQTFEMPAEITRARLGIELKNATGRLIVSNLEIKPVARTKLFIATVSGLLAAWTILVLYVGIKTFRGIESRAIKLALGGASILTIIALMLPGGIHDISTNQIADQLGIGFLDLDIVGHAVMFALLAFLVRMGRPADPLWLHIGAWILIAIASEVLQLFTVGRDPSIEDLLVDGVGFTIGLALAEIYRQRRGLSAA